jgi:hypothetical protein
MSDTLVIALLGALFNGCVTWGVVSTKLAWMRADLNRHEARLDALEKRREATA